MTTSEIWNIKDTLRDALAHEVFLVLQCKLVSGWGLRKWKSALLYGPL